MFENSFAAIKEGKTLRLTITLDGVSEEDLLCKIKNLYDSMRGYPYPSMNQRDSHISVTYEAVPKYAPMFDANGKSLGGGILINKF